MVHAGPGTRFFSILGPPGPRKTVQNGAEMVQKSINYSIKKRWFFDAGSGSTFSCFSSIFLSKWCQNGAKWAPTSIRKPPLAKKAGFRSHAAKQRVWEGKVGFGASIFESRGDQKSMKKRRSIAISIFECFFHTGSLLAPFWEPKPDSKASFLRPCFGIEKRV